MDRRGGQNVRARVPGRCSVYREETFPTGSITVERNGGAPGIDGMTTKQLREPLQRPGETIRAKLRAGAIPPSRPDQYLLAPTGRLNRILCNTREPWPHPWASYLPEAHFQRETLETGDFAQAGLRLALWSNLRWRQTSWLV